MLPFLKKNYKKDAGLVVHRESDVKPEADDTEAALHSAAKDLMDAVSSDDYKRVARALKAAFEILDASPHVEGPHLESEE